MIFGDKYYAWWRQKCTRLINHLNKLDFCSNAAFETVKFTFFIEIQLYFLCRQG